MKDDLQLQTEAVKLRRINGYGSTEPIDVIGLLLAQECYTFIRLPMTENISGMCVIDGDSKIIAVNSMMSLGRQRFTVAHELYHIEIEHRGQGVICKKGTITDSEKEADRFASYFLLPCDALEWFAEKYEVKDWTLEQIVRLSQFFRMSFQAVVYRLHQERKINDVAYHKLINSNILDIIKDTGTDMSLYMKSPEEEMEKSYGQYSQLLERAHKEERISDSLYKQFALEGFCDERWSKMIKEALIYD